MWVFEKLSNKLCSRSNIEEEASQNITYKIDQSAFQSTSQTLRNRDQIEEQFQKSDDIKHPQQNNSDDQNSSIFLQSRKNQTKESQLNEKYNKSTIENQEHYNLDKPTIKESSNVIQILKEDSNIKQNSEIRQNSDTKIQGQYKDNLFSSIAMTNQQFCDGCGVLITTDMILTNCRHVFHEKCYHQMLVKEITFKKRPRPMCFCTQQIKLFKNSLIEADLFEQLMRNQLDILKFKSNLIFRCQKCNFFAFCETSKCLECDKLEL
ncbi:hypothetical protein pb186bvf_015151 [Paramecium bursaria]